MKRCVLLLLMLPVWIGVFWTRPARAQARPQILIIANPDVKAATASKSELREIFIGETTQLKSGVKVVPILLKSGAATDAFLNFYLDKNEATFRATWRILVFSGQATMPRSLESEAAMVEFVAHTAGTIGYISRSTPHEGVRVLASH